MHFVASDQRYPFSIRQILLSHTCIIAYLAEMRHVARRVVTSSGTAWPRVQRLEVSDGGVTSGIRTSGSWVDPN